MSRWGLLLWCGPALAALPGCALFCPQCRSTPPPPLATNGSTLPDGTPPTVSVWQSAKTTSERAQVISAAAQETSPQPLPTPQAVTPPVPGSPVGTAAGPNGATPNAAGPFFPANP